MDLCEEGRKRISLDFSSLTISEVIFDIKLKIRKPKKVKLALHSANTKLKRKNENKVAG